MHTLTTLLTTLAASGQDFFNPYVMHIFESRIESPAYFTNDRMQHSFLITSEPTNITDDPEDRDFRIRCIWREDDGTWRVETILPYDAHKTLESAKNTLATIMDAMADGGFTHEHLRERCGLR